VDVGRIAGEHAAAAGRVADAARIEGALDLDGADPAAGLVLGVDVVHPGGAAQVEDRGGEHMLAGAHRQAELTRVLKLQALPVEGYLDARRGCAAAETAADA